jgi:hypothetical protein
MKIFRRSKVVICGQTDKHGVANKHGVETFRFKSSRSKYNSSTAKGHTRERDKETDRMNVIINKREKTTEDGTKYG